MNLVYLVPSWEIKHGSGSPEVPLSGYLVFGVEMCELSGIVGSHDYYLVFLVYTSCISIYIIFFVSWLF